MKRLLLILLLIPAAVTALDLGGSVQNTSIVQADLQNTGNLTLSSVLSQNDKLSLWLKAGTKDSFTFTAGLGWVFRYENGGPDFYYDFAYFNGLELLKTLEQLQFRGTIPASGEALKAVSYRAGRCRVADPSDLVLKATLDGADITLRYADFFLRFGIWYNGFIDKELSTIMISGADKSSYVDPVKVFAAPRLVQYFEADFHNLGTQTLTIFADLQEDLYSVNRLILLDGGHYYSGHLGTVLKGVIASNLYYGLTAVFNGGVYRFSDPDTTVLQAGQLFAVNAAYSFEGVLRPVLSGNILYSSGDDWDRADWEGSSFTGGTDFTSMFTPLSATTPGYIYRPKPGNLGVFKTEYSVKPSAALQVVLANTAFFRTVDGPLSLGTASGAAGNYLGDEVTLRINLRPLSDVGVSTAIGMFYPNESLVTSNGSEFRADIYLSIEF